MLPSRLTATYPDGWPGNCPEGCPSRRPYSVLLPVGFAMPPLLPVARWALTPPFHPCPAIPCVRYEPYRRTAGRFAFCGTFPGVAPAGRYPAPCFHGARTFLTRSLSAFACAAARPAGRAYKGVSERKTQTKKAGNYPAFEFIKGLTNLTWRPFATSPWCSSRQKPGSCAWRHGRHCSAGWCRRSCRHQACARQARYFMPYWMLVSGS